MLPVLYILGAAGDLLQTYYKVAKSCDKIKVTINTSKQNFSSPTTTPIFNSQKYTEYVDRADGFVGVISLVCI